MTAAMAALAAGLLGAALAAPAMAGGGDPQRGERVFQRCYACHSVNPSKTNLPGPNLSGVIGRPAAALPGFRYSPAMRARGAAGLVWTEVQLDRYLSDPEAMVPGTLMAVNGLPSAQERADVIAYLKAARP